jgi:thioredoxin-related protein
MQNELMMDVSDEKMSLKEVTSEQGLLVIFSCNTCPFVVMWEDRYAQLEEKCAETGLGMVYINSNQAKRDGDDSVEAMKAHAKKMDYSYPYLIDENSALANAFGAKTTPHIYLFNKDNELVYKGAIDDNYKNIEAVKEPYLLNAIDELLAGKKISLAETKAVGCSIKRVKK